MSSTESSIHSLLSTGLSLTFLGISLSLEEELRDAISSFDQVLQISNDASDHCLAHYHRGLCYANLDEKDAAMSDFNSAIEDLDAPVTDNSSPRLRDYRAYVYYKAVTYFNRGKLFFRQLNYASAISDFNEAIRNKPNFPEAYLQRGKTYRYKGDFAPALDDLNKYIAMIQDNPEAYTLRADVNLQLKNYREAQTDRWLYRQLLPFAANHRLQLNQRMNCHSDSRRSM